MLESQVSAAKRIFSDMILTYHQICKKSSIIFFMILFLSYFLCPIDDLSNRKFIFTNIFNDSTLPSYLIALGILFVVSLIHYIYIINIATYFKNTTLKSFFRTTSKTNLLKPLIFTYIIFALSFLLFKFFDDHLKFSYLWIHIFLNYFKLIMFYLIILFETLYLTGLKNLKESANQFNIKDFINSSIKITFIISIISLILSPFLYCLQSDLLFFNPFADKLDISSWIYYILECLINTIIVIILYNFIELMVHNKNRKIVHKRAFKRISLISLSFIYLFIWFTCGVIYQAIARQSNGRDFIFQEDIKIKLQAKALKDSTNIHADEYTICDLIKNNELQKDIIHFRKINGSTIFTSDNNSVDLNVVNNFNFNENEGFISTNKIGKYWAEFYSSDFYRRGVSYYKFEVNESIDTPQNIGIKSEKLYPVTLFLYNKKYKNSNSNFPESNKIILLGNNENMRNYTLIEKDTILIDDKSFISILKNDQGNQSNIRNPMYSNLSSILEHSIVFIDHDYKIINDTFNMIESNGVRFPLLDFLYYSAVTITTTGYGDILPNSTTIRTIVMFETFFGVGIPGLFVSLLFLKIDHKEVKTDKNL